MILEYFHRTFVWTANKCVYKRDLLQSSVYNSSLLPQNSIKGIAQKYVLNQQNVVGNISAVVYNH